MYKLEEYTELPYTQRMFINLLTALSLFSKSRLTDITVSNNRKFKCNVYNKFNNRVFTYHYYLARPSEELSNQFIDMVLKEFPNVAVDWRDEE